MRNLILTAVALTTFLSGCLGDPDSRPPFNMDPADRNDGWALSSPEAEGLDAAKLALAYDMFFNEDHFRPAYSLIVIRHGKIVAEGYRRDMADAERLNNIKAATMSVTSMLVGVAIDQKLLGPVTDPAAKVLPDYFTGNKAAITLEDLLTMRSGLHWENGIQTRELVNEPPADSIGFAADQALDFEPGKRFHFSDGSAHLVAGMLETATEKYLDDFAYETLLHPLGIENFFWERAGDGVTYGAFGLHLKPRDFAKLGQLYLQNGKWNDAQIVAPGWVTASTTTHANLNAGPYGYFLLVRPDFKAYAAAGNGGQFLYVIPALDLLLVETANPNIDPTHQVSLNRFEDVVHLVLDAVVKE